MKKAFITGITGQDGSYLAELLLNKGYDVIGLARRSSISNTQRIEHLLPDVSLYYGDLIDGSSISNIIMNVKPDEIYHLGAQSHVKMSFEKPVYTAQTICIGTANILEAAKYSGSRVYNASSSEMFGDVLEIPQTELTPFNPQSPYACAKVYAHQLCANYRKSYGMHVSSGILFNHESPRRGDQFVTKKITKAAARIKLGLQNELVLGNLDAKRDWGYAAEYVNAMWLMLQQETPDDYVIATGETYSVQDFLNATFEYLDLDPAKYVKTSESLYRPSEVNLLIGDASKAKQKLGWEPNVKFKDLVRIMATYDLAQNSKGIKNELDMQVDIS